MYPFELQTTTAAYGRHDVIKNSYRISYRMRLVSHPVFLYTFLYATGINITPIDYLCNLK